jgi:hypothetical protein
MWDEQFSTLQRLLVIQLDATSQEAATALQQHRPDLCLIVVTVQEDTGSTVGYVLQGEVPLRLYDNTPHATIQWIQDQRVDAAIVFAKRGRSPYIWAYRCYLAGVPMRIGLSREFGGQVLSHCIAPPESSTLDPHLYLLQTCGLVPSTAQAEAGMASAP